MLFIREESLLNETFRTLKTIYWLVILSSFSMVIRFISSTCCLLNSKTVFAFHFLILIYIDCDAGFFKFLSMQSSVWTTVLMGNYFDLCKTETLYAVAYY